MSETRFPNVVRAFAERPWAILPGKLEAIAELIRLRATGVEFTPEEIQARVADGAGAKPANRVRGIAVIPISGVISPRANLFSEFSGGTSIEALRNQFSEALADEDVSSILFDVNSPGGAVDLVPELARDIRAARGTKPIVAIANTLMASAAYYLGAQADEVFATPSGDVGSIGVFAVHEDFSKMLEEDGVKVSLISAGKYKTEASPYEPLSDEARSHIQELVDSTYEMFTEDVAAARGVTAETVRGGFGEGRVLHAKRAQAEGLIDGVQTFEQTVRALLASGESGRATAPLTIAGVAAATNVPVALIAEDEARSRAADAIGKRFVDEAEDARRAVAAVATRAGSLAEVARGRLTAAKRESIEELRDELVELTETLEGFLNATAPSTETEAIDDEPKEDLDLVANVASAGARIRLTRGG